jgi:hypothetical protein
VQVYVTVEDEDGSVIYSDRTEVLDVDRRQQTPAIAREAIQKAAAIIDAE